MTGAQPSHRVLEDTVDRHRRARGLTALVPHPTLQAAARQHTLRMRHLRFVAHVDPYDNTSMTERVAAIDRRPWPVLAENLAAGSGAEREAVGRWLDSPAHRANLEHPALTHIGTSVELGGEHGIYVTQLYGRAPWEPSGRWASRWTRRG